MILLGTFFDTIVQAEANGEAIAYDAHEMRLRLDDFPRGLWVVAINWYRPLGYRPARCAEVHVKQYVAMPGKTLAKVINVVWDDAKREVLLVLEVLPRKF